MCDICVSCYEISFDCLVAVGVRTPERYTPIWSIVDFICWRMRLVFSIHSLTNVVVAILLWNHNLLKNVALEQQRYSEEAVALEMLELDWGSGLVCLCMFGKLFGGRGRFRRRLLRPCIGPGH